jgi:hypothetical protein
MTTTNKPSAMIGFAIQLWAKRAMPNAIGLRGALRTAPAEISPLQRALFAA